MNEANAPCPLRAAPRSARLIEGRSLVVERRMTGEDHPFFSILPP